MSNKTKAYAFKKRPTPAKQPQAINEDATKWFHCPKCLGNLFDEAWAYARLSIVGAKEQTDVKRVTVQVCRVCGWIGNVMHEGIEATQQERVSTIQVAKARESRHGIDSPYWEAEA
jgi:hypothetical protein